MSVQSVGSPRFTRIVAIEQEYSKSCKCIPSPPSFANISEEKRRRYSPKMNENHKPSTPNALPHLKCPYSSRKVLSKEEEHVIGLLTRLNQQEESFHERKAIIINSLIPFITQEAFKTISIKTIFMIFDSIKNVLKAAPPYSAPSVFFKSIVMPNRALAKDIELSYIIMQKLLKLQPNFISPEFIKIIIKRCSSASVKDRTNAKHFILGLGNGLTYKIMKLLSIHLINAPFHGMKDLLELVQEMLKRSTDVGANQQYDELFCSLKMLHFAPHFQLFANDLVKTLLLLFEKDDCYATEMRLFLLNHWTRSDPQRSVAFMKEATEICTVGPLIDLYVWQRFSWRSSSIYMPLAMEGLRYVEKTLNRTAGYNNQVLIFLLKDTSEQHWCDIVKDRAKQILQRVPQSEPVEPKKLPMDVWLNLKNQAMANYPDAQWSNGRRRKKKK